ncbi:hypothetical protein PG996_014717 [Apiospora saccharicola]|uniref:DUF2637 domain-containing protein n=1 Tax=Apiospora saccharicola TaxID=335842 RepID=A0ABR1TLT5_9PEZI
MPNRSFCSQHSVWAVTLTTATLTSVLVGFAFAISSWDLTPNLHATCDTKYDPAFWQRLTQLLVHETIILCLVSPAVRPNTRDRIRLPGRGWFLAAVAASALTQVLATVSYAATCGNPGWTASLFMEWLADVTLVGAAAQLAGGIARPRRRSVSPSIHMQPMHARTRTPTPAAGSEP